jgi:periplasmic protein TonB
MNKLFLFFLLPALFLTKSYGQLVTTGPHGVIVEITKEKRNHKISFKVKITSAFPDVDSAWIRFVERNVSSTIELDKRAKKGKYIVAVKFIVAKDGSINDIACEKDPGFGSCREVIRVIKKSKNWTPAQQNGRQVSEYRRG